MIFNHFFITDEEKETQIMHVLHFLKKKKKPTKPEGSMKVKSYKNKLLLR